MIFGDQIGLNDSPTFLNRVNEKRKGLFAQPLVTILIYSIAV